MQKLILGIESSCDDTAASIINIEGKILSNIIHTQIEEHAPYSGVVPEIASRSHLNKIERVVSDALGEAGVAIQDIDYIAATGGPGLIGGVLVGTVFAKTISSILSKPYYAINHLEGHILSVTLSHNIDPPFICLLVSGGHCLFVLVNRVGEYKIIGQTLDDSAGEALDKFARMLGLSYPGGPIVEQLAKKGDEKLYSFARPMIGDRTANMSFSGLKTSARNFLLKHPELGENDINDLCASFQKTIKDILCIKSIRALEFVTSDLQTNKFILVGGVAANLYIRKHLDQTLNAHGYQLYVPDVKLCTDNAAMIACAALHRIKNNYPPSNINFTPKSRWSVEDIG